MPSVGATSKLRVAFISAETEHCLVGGLGEVAKALPETLQKRGVSVTRFAPLHDVVWRSTRGTLREVSFPKNPEVSIGGKKIGVTAYELQDATVPTIYFKDVPEIPDGITINGEGIPQVFLGQGLQVDSVSARAIINACFSRFFYQGGVYPERADLGEKFFFATRAVLELIQSGRFGGFDLIHFQDWHFSLIPTLIRYDSCYQELAQIATVGTIHNPFSLGYSPKRFEELSGLTQAEHPELYQPWQGLLHADEMHFLKGVQHADITNTVSPTFARELLSPAKALGFDGLIRYLHSRDRFVGILNGIDERWNPTSDDFIAAKFSADDCSGKTLCKANLRERFGLKYLPEAPLFGILSRMTLQKGFDILIPIVEPMVQKGVQFAFVGSHDAGQDFFKRLENISRRLQGMVSIKTGYIEKQTHDLYSGCDIFIRPSSYEPCGLSQMVAMKYGSVPIVHKTGGLADTVFDIDENPHNGNGFAFNVFSKEALQEKMQRALMIFRHHPELWKTLMLRDMGGDFYWGRSVDQYLDLYQRALENARERKGK